MHVPLVLDNLVAAGATLDARWVQVAFLLLLVGYGTKMGLSPLHTWLPDAHSEAPSPVSALLSGALLNCAFLGILRGLQICSATGIGEFARELLIGFGILSMSVAAIFLLRPVDYKRMLAYSSVEHMGILVIGVAVGGLAAYGAMFHVLNNALVKSALFLSAGNIHRYYGSKRRCEITGSLHALPFSAGVFLVGFLAITGSPPFAPFLSEFSILRGIFIGEHYYLGAAFIFLLAIIFIGMGSTVLPVTLGPANEDVESPYFRETALTVISPILLLVTVLVLGIYLPAPLHAMFTQAAALVEIGQ
jgi:hydrogenase-4 component F